MSFLGELASEMPEEKYTCPFCGSKCSYYHPKHGCGKCEEVFKAQKQVIPTMKVQCEECGREWNFNTESECHPYALLKVLE